MSEPVDYLVLGSGLSALSFSALMAKQGKSVKILEAHEFFGGYGHTFPAGEYQFNAQLHYVISCGAGDIVHTFLKKLGLAEQVTFNRLNADGYDRVFCGDQKLFIPYGYDNLRRNMQAVCPAATAQIKAFIDILVDFNKASQAFPRHLSQAHEVLAELPSYLRLFKYRSATLQQVFDACQLPKILQTLVAGQLIDYMLPPKDLSFLAWAALFNAYGKGAYYPTKHFNHVFDSIIDSIRANQGQLIPNQRVVGFITAQSTVLGVHTQGVDPATGICSGPQQAHYGRQVICNFDPKAAAHMIGMQKFSRRLQRQLDYDYSYSSFVLYGIVKDIDLAQHGFGDWNIWHCQPDHNQAFADMYDNADYSKPYFAMNCRSLHTSDRSNCPTDGTQGFQICTVANYGYWMALKLRSTKAYNRKKREVLDHLLDAVEQHYVPGIRKHLVLKMAGSPTTNERYVNSPNGGSYGVNLTPRNFSFFRKLTADTSLENFHFCSAAAGVGGFGGTIMTGVQLYESLTKDYLD